MLGFEWDEDKAAYNLATHGISFEAAAHVFDDRYCVELYDFAHSTPFEERYIVIGKVEDILFVVYTERGENIRLISARYATPKERREYYGQNGLL